MNYDWHYLPGVRKRASISLFDRPTTITSCSATLIDNNFTNVFFFLIMRLNLVFVFLILLIIILFVFFFKFQVRCLSKIVRAEPIIVLHSLNVICVTLLIVGLLYQLIEIILLVKTLLTKLYF